MKRYILIIGSGRKDVDKRIKFEPKNGKFENVITTLDINDLLKPDVVWDLNERPLPFKNGEFHEIHAYEVLEHLGSQGDFQTFFKEFGEYWRILKKDGLFCGSVPRLDGVWTWGDPGHTWIITPEQLSYLDKKYYEIKDNQATDYRKWWKRSFERVWEAKDDDNYYFALKKQ